MKIYNLVKKMFTNGRNIGLPLELESKRQSMEWKHCSQKKKKFQVQWSVKKVRLIVFWDTIRPNTINFLEKSATVNSASYCQPLKQNSPYLLNDSHVYITIGSIIQKSKLYNATHIFMIIRQYYILKHCKYHGV